MTTSKGADLEATKTLNSTVAGIHKSLVTLENSKTAFYKAVLRPRSSLLSVFPGEMIFHCSHKNLSMNLYSRTRHNHQKRQTIQMPFNAQMVKPWSIHTKGYCWSIKLNVVVSRDVTTWMYLRNI